ncbi:MAG TPA: hypothetical protein PK093_14175 [Phycisphaerae bacterium]|nr:hypothetical protein [Phycisphaerae bacterium]
MHAQLIREDRSRAHRRAGATKVAGYPADTQLTDSINGRYG